MEYILKLTAACIVSAVMALTVKKQNPEMAILLGIAGAVGCLWCAAECFTLISEQFRQWQSRLPFSPAIISPLVKCLGIAVVSQFGVSICKDSGQSAVASGLELCGNAAAAWCLLPLLNHLFALIEDML